MSRIEDIIKNNKEQFDDLEPKEGHFERFAQKLEQYHKKRKHFSVSFLLKVAAVAVLLIVSGVWVFDQFWQSGIPEKFAYQKIDPEFKETQMYYTTQVQKRYNKIKSFEFNDKQQKQMLLEEIHEMDSIYYNIRQDIKTNPNDPRVIHAMIKHYQMKLEVMDQILNQLKSIENINQNKQQSHENKEI